MAKSKKKAPTKKVNPKIYNEDELSGFNLDLKKALDVKFKPKKLK